MLVALGTLVATEVSAQAPASVVQSGRAIHPPSEAGKASRAARAQAQTSQKRSSLDAHAERHPVTPAAFDGSWSVAINTRSGACEPNYRFGVQIINGNVVHEGRAAGRVSANGSVQVSISTRRAMPQRIPLPMDGSPFGFSGPLMAGGCAGGESGAGIRFRWSVGTRGTCDS
jgi:hypothetical protein